MTGEATIFHYDAAGKLIAEYSTIVEPISTAQVSYLTNDYLGSPRITTNKDGDVYSKRDLLPFGEELTAVSTTQRAGYGTDTVRQKFTGYERDSETELDFAVARIHNYNHGRFSSPDDWLNDTAPESPKSWNLYTYVRNNPLRYIDPVGEKIYVYTTREVESKDDEGNIVKKTETVVLRYAEGKLWNVYTDNAKVEYAGDDKYARAVQKDLNELKEKGNDVVKDVISTLESSDNSHRISMPGGGGSADSESKERRAKGKPTGSYIGYNPWDTDIGESDRLETGPAAITLFHELGHAWIFDQGAYSDVSDVFSQFNGSKLIEGTEVQAVWFENQAWSIYDGIKPRKTYAFEIPEANFAEARKAYERRRNAAKNKLP
ncbi:MAG: M91 family zinc metallopeptidase [Acidobacteriota bacterium]|nr:M91 family zinc metallopeptidase [Acidobacteriota bacterium]MDH3527948.1 M91 family zinc metallopeptidase [Acidobacteriota bacterium]